MTIGEWLRSRDPQPPAALLARLEEVLGDALAEEVAFATDRCLAAGERITRPLVSGNSSSRASALELLTADALVTYAYEAASSRPDRIAGDARDALNRVAAMIAEPSR